jgi:hypothetical protein
MEAMQSNLQSNLDKINVLWFLVGHETIAEDNLQVSNQHLKVLANLKICETWSLHMGTDSLQKGWVTYWPMFLAPVILYD